MIVNDTPLTYIISEDVTLYVDEDSEGDLLFIDVTIGAITLTAFANVTIGDSTIHADGFHIQSNDIEANTLGPAKLRQIAQAIMEKLDYDWIIITGSARTTGANPSRSPKPVRLQRKRGASL